VVNNSLARLIDGMVATLRQEVIPHVEGDYARGQAFGVVYMLNSLKLRASWSNAFLIEQLRALEEASDALAGFSAQLPNAPLPNIRAPRDVPDAAALQALRDEGDAQVCALIEWLVTHRSEIADATAGRVEAILDRYLHRQARHELATSAKPMFVEMSGGAQKG
jgi:hypothetical protein